MTPEAVAETMPEATPAGGGPRLKVLIVAPYLDGHDVGEIYTAFRLLEELAAHCDLTILAFECFRGPPLAQQLPAAEVITFPEPGGLFALERVRGMVKPGALALNGRVRRWLTQALAAGRRFDLAHQILPRAPRYPTALRHFDIPYVVGSLGGSLPTPPGFRAEVRTERWFARLRALDGLRLRHDPWLRASYARAALVLGVAPYMRAVLAPVPLRRFEPFLGIGVGDLAPEVARPQVAGRLKLLHVGRAVRTKGLRDVVRALAHLPDLPDVTLTSAGDGEELAICRTEAERLGVAARVRFLGRLERADLEPLYRDADAFVFPSFRESMGGVIYEAQRWGLPVIAARAGGPDWIVDADSGLKVAASDPETMPRELAGAIRTLALDPGRRARMGAAGRARLAREGLWPEKAHLMHALYRQIAAPA